MKTAEINTMLKTAAGHYAPSALDVPRIEAGSQNGCIEFPEAVSKKRSPVRAVVAAAAVFLFVALGISGMGLYNGYYAVDTVIGIDVNPSIELRLSRQERVLEAVPLNKDAEVILDGMDLKGAGLNVAVNALTGSMLKHGYLSELANSILISVENKDSQKSAELQRQLAEEIDALLQSSSIRGAILSQTVTEEESLRALAQTYQISLGKAALIQKILPNNSTYTEEMLAGLSINELNLLAASGSGSLQDVAATGSASDRAYIGTEAAEQAAFGHAGVDRAAAERLKTKLDLDDGKMVYEVEFVSGGTEFEYEIDAETGKVLKSERETRQKKNGGNASSGSSGSTTSPSGNSVPDAGAVIGAGAAQDAALGHAGLNAGQVSGLWAELDRENGILVYEVEFISGNTEYEYVIDGATGTVLSFHTETESGEAKQNPPSGEPGGNQEKPLTPPEDVREPEDDDLDNGHDDFDDDEDEPDDDDDD